MTINSQSEGEHYEITEEQNVAYIVILGVGSWGCGLMKKLAQDKNIKDYHNLFAMDSNPDNLDASGAAVKIHLGADTLIAIEQGRLHEADYPEIFGDYRQHFEKADLIFVLVDTNEASLENYLRCLGILLNKAVLHPHALTIALLNNTELPKDLVYANTKAVIDHWRPDTYIDLNKTERCRYAIRNASNLKPGAWFQACVDSHVDIIRSITDSLLYKGLICVDFADIYAIFSARSETYYSVGTSSRPDLANQSAVMACCIVEARNAYIWEVFDEVGGVFVNIRAADISISEFNLVGDVIHGFVGEETIIKITTTVDDSLGDEMVVSVFAAEKTIY